MGNSRKYGQITTEQGNVPPAEPVFMVRARDITSVDLITDYLTLCVRAGSPRRHLELVMDTLNDFRKYQTANKGELKIPQGRRSGGMADV